MTYSLRSIVLFTALCAASATAQADVFYDTYKRGLAAFKDRDYTAARSEFLRAYDLRPEPIILFNVAQTYRLELDAEQALIYYRRFLAESKISEDLREEAQAYVTALEADQRAREEQKKRDASVGPKEHDGTPVKVMQPPMERVSPPSPVAIPTSVAEDRTGRWNARRKIALGTVAGGTIALGVGVTLGVLAKRKQSDAQALCSDPQVACDNAHRANDLLHTGHALAIDADVAFGVATAAAIAAAVLWLTGAPESHHRVTLVPSASSGQVLVAAHGSF